jgi:hypothetical protein
VWGEYTPEYMSKRTAAAVTPIEYPEPKQPRLDDVSPLTSERPRGRVVLDVGGTRFVSSKSSLERASTYFRSLLMRWDEQVDEPLFIDADADAFQVLLSYMRVGTLTLPKHDEGLCVRALLHAEYLGMDALLTDVKARAYANMRSEDSRRDDARPPAIAFDEEVGTLADAIAAGVLPQRFFAATPRPPPEPPERTVKALLPAAPGYHALFTADTFDEGEAQDDGGDMAPSESLPIISFALVEYRDGKQTVDAVVQRALDDTRASEVGTLAPMHKVHAHEKTNSHMVFASEYRGSDHNHFAQEEVHWVVVPPAAPGQLLPIPPGSVRGVWSKPAVTAYDTGKRITITGGKLTVDGEARGPIDWNDTPVPSDITGNILGTMFNDEGDRMMRVAGSTTSTITMFKFPRIKGQREEIDLAFASMDGPCDQGPVKTTFYMPVACGMPHRPPEHRLVPAQDVTFGDMKFSHYIGAKRD